LLKLDKESTDVFGADANAGILDFQPKSSGWLWQNADTNFPFLGSELDSV
jgi:hypothetical protein